MRTSPSRAPAGPVIVTDGETRAALACVRSLGARGLPVHVLAARPPALAGASRFASRVHAVPDAETAPEAWAEAVRRIAAELPGALVLPITEIAIGSLFAFGVDRALPLATPSREAYALAVDKHALLVRARACGLEVPRSVLFEDPAAIDDLPRDFPFPAFAKARRSRWLATGRWHKGSCGLVRDRAELRAAVASGGYSDGLLVQEFVPGHGEGLFFLADKGETRVRFAHRRLREKPPSGGVSVLSESIEPDPVSATAGERLLAELAWHGVAMLELRRCPDGRAVVMELNPRLWGSLQLAIDAGVDFPALLVALLRGEPLPPAAARTGVRVRWLWGDVDHLWIAWRDERQRAAIGRSRGAALRAFLRSFFDGSRLEVERSADLAPAWRELRSRIG
jgi:predicted ATP-grasp superfamily ATP-dependent carboligase